MARTAVVNRAGNPVAEQAIAALASDVAGRLIGPADAEYDRARRIWNAMIERYPGLILRCRGVADVIRAVRFAAEHDLLVAVRGGGHNVAGRALCDGGLVIDLSDMRAVFVDPAERIVRAQGGATLGDVDRETHLHGLAVPLGVVSKTGISGLTLGGGVGWLVRRYGPTCDNVLAFEVVSADGVLMTASITQNPDLFWGLRGGGGNFGIVTSFTYRAYPVSIVMGGLLVYPRDKAVAVLRNYRDYLAAAPDAVTAYAAMLTTPGGMPAVAIVACHSGDPAEAERDLAPLRSFGPPALDAIQPMPFPAMQKLLDAAFPDGTRNYWKSAFVSDLSDVAIDVLVAQANAMRSPLSSIVVGSITAVPRTAMAKSPAPSATARPSSMSASCRNGPTRPRTTSILAGPRRRAQRCSPSRMAATTQTSWPTRCRTSSALPSAKTTTGWRRSRRPMIQRTSSART